MLTNRKIKVLEAIIKDFIYNASPVGSRTLSKKYLIGTSSATIRNEMADLEELGYLLQPHTSAGRVPSDLGYRLFVDSMTEFNQISLHDVKLIHSMLFNQSPDAKDIVQKAMELLVEMTGCAAIVRLPKMHKAKLENIKLIKVNDSKALMIVVTDGGTVKSVELTDVATDQTHLDQIAQVILNTFSKRPIEEIDMKYLVPLRNGNKDIDYIIPLLRKAFKSFHESELFVAGANSLLVHQEVGTAEQTKVIFDYLADKSEIERLIYYDFEKNKGQEIAIIIGSELNNELLSDFAIVAKEYRVNEVNTGFVAIFGPKRMDYKAVGTLVGYIAKSLSEVFSGINL